MATATKDGYKYLDGNSKNIKGNMLKDKKKKILITRSFLYIIFLFMQAHFLHYPRSHFDWWYKPNIVIFFKDYHRIFGHVENLIWQSVIEFSQNFTEIILYNVRSCNFTRTD